MWQALDAQTAVTPSRLTFCWSFGSRGPSKAAVKRPLPSALLSGACSDSSSGTDGSGAHHSAWPAYEASHRVLLRKTSCAMSERVKS